MKKLYFLFLLITTFSAASLGQSGQWGYIVDLNPINTNNRHAKSSGSGTYFRIQSYNSDETTLRAIILETSSFRQERGEWVRFIVPMQIHNFNDRVPKVSILHRVDWEGGGSNWAGNDINLFPSGYNKLQYNYFRVCKGAHSSNCQFSQDLFNQMEGHVDVYTFPKNINIKLKSDGLKGVSAEDKVKIEAPAGYGTGVYRWVYKKDRYDTAEQWKPVYNSSLIGNNILEATLVDIYGPGFMNEGVVNFKSSTFICLEYDVYKDSSNPKVKEYSNVIPVDNKLIAPKIISAVGGKTLCPGERNGKITVKVDRPLLQGEIIYFWTTLEGGIKDNKKDAIPIDSTTYEIMDLYAGTYSIGVNSQLGDGGYSANANAVDHERAGIKVTEPDPLSYTVNGVDMKHISCKGGNDGAFKVTAAGGVAPYTLFWKLEEDNDFIHVPDNRLEVTGLSAGIYRYYIQDFNACKAADPGGGTLYESVNLTEPAESIAVNLLPDKTAEPTGNGRSDGYITAGITGGTPPYTVVWKEKVSGTVLTTVDNTTAGESKLYNISAGTYVISVTDSKGCSLSTAKEFTLNEPGVISVTITQPAQILCYGETSASLSASASGGKGGPFTYVWSKKENGVYVEISTGPNLNNLGAGDYKVMVSDNATPPNEREAEYTIQEPLELTASATKSDVSCKNANTGSISLTISGGLTPYIIHYRGSDEITYHELSTNASSFDITGLKAGYYNYYVTDGNDCRAKIGAGSSGQMTITEPDIALVILSSKLTNPTGAERSDGSITIKVEGGIPYSTGDKYVISWKKGGNPVNSSISLDGDGIVTSEIEGLSQGIYNVEIKDNSPSRCIIYASYNLTAPPPLTVRLEETKRIDCFGNNTARIEAVATGGIPRPAGSPYTYQWYKVEAGVDMRIENEDKTVLDKVGIGTYKMKIEDGSTPPNTAESSIVISQPSEVKAEIIKTGNISCFEGSDGFIQLSVSGGSGGYRLYYKHLADADYKMFSTLSPGNVFILDNLPAGQFRLYVQDVNGCLAQISGQEDTEVELTAPQKPLSVVSQTINTPSGQGRSDGSIMIVVEGGTPFDSGDMYAVSWKDENGRTLVPENGQDAQGRFTSVIRNLPKGVYLVDIRDKNYRNTGSGCFLATSITLTDPPPLLVNVEITGTVKCFGDHTGKLTAYATGGIPYLSGLPYKYTWYRVADGIETAFENKNDSILSGIPAGSYKVRIEDGSAVTNLAESGIISLSQPEESVVTLVETRMISCHQGSDGYIHISAKGGTGNHKLYYKQTGIDTQYHEMSSNSSRYTFELNSLPAGTYSIYVLDENLCYASIRGENISEIVLTQPDKALSIVTDTVYDPTAYGLSNGEIQIRLDGGTPEYTVIWTDEKGTVLTAENSVTDGLFTSVLTGLGEGKYRLEVRDANYATTDQTNNSACILTGEYELIQPEEFTLALEETHYISCYELSDGEITAHVAGGVKNKDKTPPLYKFTWYREEKGSFVEMPDVKDFVLTKISAGTYKLEVEDYARIPNKLSDTVRIIQPEPLTAVSSGDIRVVCGELATVFVRVSGGTLPYTYRWNTGDASPELREMVPGKYMAVITDARGCETTAIARVISPSDLTVSSSLNDPVCYQSTNGSIVTEITGGTAPYAYKWNTGATTKDLPDVGAGIYTVIVTDNDGCIFSESFELKDPEPITVDLGEDLTLCIGQSYLLEPEVEDSKTVFNWTGPSGFQSGESKVELSRAGVYSLTITDSKGCQATDEIEVFVTDYGISSEMVVATDMFVNDTIVLVNISSPDPERMEWLFSDKDPIEIVETTPETAKIIFRQQGEYIVGMRTFVKDCYQDIMKTLNVTVKDGFDTDNFGQAGIIAFVVYPNPNNGTFSVKVELDRQSTVRLRLFSLVRGGAVDDRTLSGSKLYDEPYLITVSPGVYILLLETASGRKSFKMIVN